MKVVNKVKDYIYDNRYYIVIGAIVGVSVVACREVYSLGKAVGARKGFDAMIKSLCDINPELALQIAKEAVEQGKETIVCNL